MEATTINYKKVKQSDFGTGTKPVFSHMDENRFTNDPNATIDQLRLFTETYKKYSLGSKGIREVECLKVQYPLYFCDIQATDLFAGRDRYPAIGFGAQAHTYFGYYMEERLLNDLQNHSELSPENASIIEELKAFWRIESDAVKTRLAYPEKMQKVLSKDAWYSEPIIGAPLYRMSGTQCDFDKLIQLGIPGLRNEIQRKKEKVASESEAWWMYEAMHRALDLFSEVANFYADMATSQSLKADPNRKEELQGMETVLRNISTAKPQNFREAIQLMFLYADISGSYNYGRMDEYLADLLVSDLDSGKIDEEEAIRLLSNLWYLMDAKGNIWDCRVIVGGKGRRNEENADRLALIIMETTKRVKGIVPQLTLRFYKEQNPALYQKALDVIATGNPYPMLYNDEVNIPSVANAFKISTDEAVNYIPFGCGEYVLYHRSVGTPSGVINLLQALSVTLHQGINPVTGKAQGLPKSEMEAFDNFDGLLSSYKKQVEYYIEQLAYQEKLEYDMAAKSANYLYLSMLFDDCIAAGLPIFGGGVRYLGGTLETYGNTNTADSLAAIKKLVYDDKTFTLDELIEMLNINFEGFEKERQLLLNVPKYGNDIAFADDMKVEVDRHVSEAARDMAEKAGLHSYLIVIINNSANATMGQHTTASPDGRKAFTYMANANSATGGADKNGLTAYLNSIVKPITKLHAGAVQNLKFSKDLLSTYREQTEMLLKTYFENGGAQCMINCLGKSDLENAMKEPEKYSNLIVRVGGFSARFVELEREVQLEILNRTMY
ncbi:MAG: pyruvate formate lyase family protein [Prolixibacteraceae bacterium]